MSANWKRVLGAVFTVGIAAAATAAPFKRGGWNPPPGGWDVVWEGQHLAADGWINSSSLGDPGMDGNYRTWADNWDPDDVTTQTIVGGGETEDGVTPAANAIILQLQDNYSSSDNGHGRRLQFALPLPGTYDTRPDNIVRNPELNIVNVNKGVTVLVRFKVVAGTYMEPDTGMGESVYEQSLAGIDCSDGDDDQVGIAVGTDRIRWTTSSDTKSTPILVGDMTGAATQAKFRTFWIVFEPGVNLNNWKATLWVDGQLTPSAPTMGGPGDAGPNGTFAGPADGDQSMTENWFMYFDDIETNSTLNGNATSYPEYAGKAFLLIGPGRTTAMVTWQYDYICFKAGAFYPTPPPTSPPNPPSNLTAQSFGNGVLLRWTDNSSNESEFRLERRTAATAYAEIAQPAADDTSYTDTAVAGKTTYIYRIRAVNSVANSAYSNEATATPLVSVNLALSDCDASPSAPAQLAPGDPLILLASVGNDGRDAAGPFWTEVWGSRTGGLTLDRFLAASLYLPAGLSSMTSFTWTASTPLYSIPDGPYTVVYAVDRPGDVAETSERDNRAIVHAKRILVIRRQTQIDLAVEGFALSPNPAQSGQPVAFAGRVVNRGTQASGPFWIEFWGSWDWPYPGLNFFLCDSIFVANLDPGGAADLPAHPRQLYNVPAGIFMVGCFADRDDAINESDETNNYQFVEGQVFNQPIRIERERITPQNGGDIRITAADFSPAAPTQLAPGDEVTFTINIANTGSANTGPFWLEYWGSRDGGVTLGDFLADSNRLSNLAPGQTVQLSTTKRLYGLPDGPYSVVVVADRPSEIAETDESNNRRVVASKRLLVIRPPTGANLVIENFGVADPYSFAGTFIGKVRNFGAAASGPFWVEFWACPDDPDYPWLDRFAYGSIRAGNLAPGAEIDLGPIVRGLYPNVSPGPYAVICFVDRLDEVNETDETDNYAVVRGVNVAPH